MSKERGLSDNIFKDKTGKIVLWQNPNIPLWLWIVSTLMTHILPYGQANFFFSLVAFGSIFTWGYLEITSGVDYFRRIVGLIVLLWVILSRL